MKALIHLERPISWAEGFLPPKFELGWPHGVQEEYDVHWDLSPAPTDEPLIEDITGNQAGRPVVERVTARAGWRRGHPP